MAGSGVCVLTDRGTWRNFKNRADLGVLVAGDQRLFNQYGVMALNPAKYPQVKAKDAQKLVDWVTSTARQRTLDDDTINGQQLFFPNADSQPTDASAQKFSIFGR